MNRVGRQLAACITVAICCGWYGCGGVGSTVPNDGGSLAGVALGGGADTGSGQPLPDSAGSDPPVSGSPVVVAGAASARVRNESLLRQADVTVRFIRDDVVVRLAFIRVAPETATTVLGAQAVDTVELSGVDSQGAALTGAALIFGRDFDTSHPAEYVILDDRVEVGTPDTLPPVDEVQVRPVPDGPSSVSLLEPSADKTALVGSTVTVRWSDSVGAVGGVVRLFLRAVGSDALISLGPAVDAALDGINDEFRAVLGGVAPGVYEVLAEIDDGRATVTSVAPGRLTVVTPVAGENAPPSLSILSPVVSPAPMALSVGSSFEVSWEDSDADNNATIVFTLEPSDPAQVGLGVFQVSPPFAEDPDGPAFDRATLSVGGVLPGLYDLVGTISDGTLSDVARVERAILVGELPETPNLPPTIAILEPSVDFETPVGSSFFVRWTDEDADDNARISLLLDPDVGAGARDGNEILLINSVSEDVDGTGDEVQIGLAADISPGEYNLIAVISDGTAEMESRAPGIVVVIEVNDGRHGGGLHPPDDEGNPPNGPPGNGQTVTMLDPLVGVGGLTASMVSLAIPFSGPVIADNIPERVTLTNEPFGGHTTVEFVPAQWAWESGDDLRVVFPRDLVPNTAWPRSFEVRIRLSGTYGFSHELTSPNPVWLPQDVELLDVVAVDYRCGSTGELIRGDARFAGLAVDWFGGGVREETPGAEVEFWLSGDGVVPAADQQDTAHRLIWRSPGSPHVTRTAYIDEEILHTGLVDGLETAGSAPPNTGRSADLDPGDYHLMAVVNLDDGGRLIALTYPVTVSVCLPASSAVPSD